MSEGNGDCLGAAVDAEFRKHPLDVGGDGLGCDEEFGRDLALAVPRREEVEDFALTGGQAVEVGGHPAVALSVVGPAVDPLLRRSSERARARSSPGSKGFTM